MPSSEAGCRHDHVTNRDSPDLRRGWLFLGVVVESGFEGRESSDLRRGPVASRIWRRMKSISCLQVSVPQ